MSNQWPPAEAQPAREPVRVQMPDNKPYATIALIMITALFFALQYISQILIGRDLLFIYMGKINQAIMMGQVWRLVTPAFLHGSITHIFLNMYALFVIGRRLERFYGPGRFLALYFLSAFAGNVLSFVLTPAPSLGASTAVFGIFAAEGMFIYQNRKLFDQNRTRQAITNLAIILVINLAFGFSPGTNIDNMGHIGGLLGGLFFAWKAGPELKLSGQPPMLSIKDGRNKTDIAIAGLVVLIGFTVIALFPFIAP